MHKPNAVGVAGVPVAVDPVPLWASGKDVAVSLDRTILWSKDWICWEKGKAILTFHPQLICGRPHYSTETCSNYETRQVDNKGLSGLSERMLTLANQLQHEHLHKKQCERFVKQVQQLA